MADIDAGSARAALPGTLQYGRVRPLFARARDVRVAPSTGFTNYQSGQEITFNLPTGNDMWLDQRNSYILCDFGVSVASNEPGVGTSLNLTNQLNAQLIRTTIALGDYAVASGGSEVSVGLDGGTVAMIREWKTYLNGVLVEDFERPNVLANVMQDVHSDHYDTGLRLGPCGAGVGGNYTCTDAPIVSFTGNADNPPKGNFMGRMPYGANDYTGDGCVLNRQDFGIFQDNVFPDKCVVRNSELTYNGGVALSQVIPYTGVMSATNAIGGTDNNTTAPNAWLPGPPNNTYQGNSIVQGGPNVNRISGQWTTTVKNLEANNPFWLASGMVVNIPSSCVGLGTDRMLPLAFFQSVRSIWTLEYAHIALQIQNTVIKGPASTANNAVPNYGNRPFPKWKEYCDTATYTIGNVYWYMRIIELDGDVLSFVADAYASGGVPRFLFPMEQWIHKYRSTTNGTVSAVIPFNFNITSAKGVIVTLRMEDSELHGVKSCQAQYCLSDRFGGYHLQDWQLTINGRSFPEYGAVTVYDSGAKATTQQRQTGADGLYKALGAVAGNIASHTPGRITLNDWRGPGVYPLKLTSTGGPAQDPDNSYPYHNNTFDTQLVYYDQNDSTTLYSYNMMGGPSGSFFIGLPLEPADITEGSTSRAGVRLSAANDVSLRFNIRTFSATDSSTTGDFTGMNVQAGNCPAVRVDVFILADTEFAFEQGAVTKIGAS